MNSRAIIAGCVVLGGLLALGASLAGVKYLQIRRAMSQPPQPERAESVGSSAVERASWHPTARLSGTVVALESVTLSNEVAGTIKDVLFESGSPVDAGQILVRLDSSTQQADLEAAQANVRVAEAAVLVAESIRLLRQANHARMTRAGESGAATESELDQSQANVVQADAALVKAKAEVDLATARVRQISTTIEKLSLRAPFHARAGLRYVHPGQFLAEGTGVVGLQSIADRIYLDFALPQDQIWRVRVGNVVDASIPAIGPEPQPIEVVAIDAVADRGTRNIRVRGVIANPRELLRPGMWIDVEVAVEAPREYLVVPTTAVRRSPYGDHVFVIAPDPKAPDTERAKQRFVTLGPTIGATIIVTEGLTDGEIVATEGSFKLRDDALVKRESTPADTARAEHASEPGVR